jgi:diguanylate cyclase (GGDEF)-like protein
MFLDLDRFKEVNDTLGHQSGDELLVQVAERLRGCIRESDTVARLGGDEFTVILEMLERVQDCTAVADKILRAMASPFRLQRQTVFVTASIGIALYPFAGENAETLIRNADTAMYRAKEAGRGRWSLYSSDMSAYAAARLAVENALHSALELGQFELWYQPLYAMQGGRLTGFEALLRWNRPGLGTVLPAEFVPLLEDTGQIVQVGEWVLDTACRQAALWRDAGLEPARVSVNLSSRQFNDPELADKVAAALAAVGLEPERLELELTESCLVDDHESAKHVMHRVKAMGVRLSLDDFGTGYSSMNYLKHFPLDGLKIDRSFIKDLPDDRDSIAITSAIIALARSLRLEVVAEGVETGAQLEHLRNQGSDRVQGFLFNPPMGEGQATDLLRLTGTRPRGNGEEGGG